MEKVAQIALFNEIKSLLGPNKSLANEVADILGVSLDSAYRRIRNEKPLTMDELMVLVNTFRISLDSLLHLKSDTLLFNYQTLNNAEPEYRNFLNSINNDLQQLSKIEGMQVIIAAKDFPIFYNFFIPEIAGFKSFFWKKTILQLPGFKNARFDPSELDAEENKIGLKIAHQFCKVKTHQLWNEEVFTSFINQLQYYYESGFIDDKKIMDHMFDKTHELAVHFQEMAESGMHYLPGETGQVADSYQLYQNDVIFGDNTIIVHSPDLKRVYFTHNVIDTLYTHDVKFAEYSYTTHQNIMNRSVLLSKSSERERNRFFKKIREKILARKSQL